MAAAPRNYATFASSLPDDAVERDGHIVVPGGRAVLESFAAQLRARAHATSKVEQHSHYGWAFDAAGPGGRSWCLLQCGYPWLLIVEDRRGLKRLWAGARPFAATLATCEAALQSLEHVSAVQWHTLAGFDAYARAQGPQK